MRFHRHVLQQEVKHRYAFLHKRIQADRFPLAAFSSQKLFEALSDFSGSLRLAQIAFSQANKSALEPA